MGEINDEIIDEKPPFYNSMEFPNNGFSIQPSIASTSTANESETKNKDVKGKVRKSKNKSSNMQKVDTNAKLERSRQSARECRARKKLRYQYLEDLVNKREHANIRLMKEFDQLQGIVSLLSSDQYHLETVREKYKSIQPPKQ
ncbi:cAMP-responsive element-binding protein-like 2 [Dermatophagoides pteronyssinus]|uniref:cAMP-responsive element-binding protein-like 2 n=1 Tax=Dermatophagoides pteronyssinus TaxID=6956 RepID=A0ABQ8IXA0_DERPT|nr:cAMP-responsive element-binding protein-like 2 [Dermatophagoides pteronyssinus]